MLVQVDPSQTSPILDIKYTDTVMACLGTVWSVLFYVENKESVLKHSWSVDVWNGSDEDGSLSFGCIGCISVAPFTASLRARPQHGECFPPSGAVDLGQWDMWLRRLQAAPSLAAAEGSPG